MKTKLLLFILSISIINTFVNAQNADIDLLRSINLERNKNLDPLFNDITHTAVPLSFALPLTLFSVSLFNKDQALQRSSMYMEASVISAAVASTTLKYIINRQRPYIPYPELDVQTSGASSSFPSGHTTVAFATATALHLSYPKWYYIAPAYLWAGSVAYSRMHLGVHYPSDVLAGALIGSGTSFICFKIKEMIEKKCERKRIERDKFRSE